MPNDQYNSRHEYWETFYSKQDETSAPRVPSQFAAFVLNEFPKLQGVVEVGCGNGRDAEFFASYGLRVLGIDASEQAIERCRKQSGNSNAEYTCRNLDDIEGVTKEFFEKGDTMLYARFFLHAISLEEESAFIALLSRILPAGGILALEYRTLDDQHEEKIFGKHYRRFANHEHVCRKIEAAGFDILYEIEGIGFAKYKTEDAKVGRCIARLSAKA